MYVKLNVQVEKLAVGAVIVFQILPYPVCDLLYSFCSSCTVITSLAQKMC